MLLYFKVHFAEHYNSLTVFWLVSLSRNCVQMSCSISVAYS